MEIAVWIVSGLLAFAMLGAGAGKLVMPRDKHVAQQPWAGDFTRTQVRLIGVAEVLAAFGLILPRLLDIVPVLSPLAAAGVVLLQAGAISVHVRRKEMFVPNIVILVLAGFVATAGFLGY